MAKTLAQCSAFLAYPADSHSVACCGMQRDTVRNSVFLWQISICQSLQLYANNCSSAASRLTNQCSCFLCPMSTQFTALCTATPDLPPAILLLATRSFYDGECSVVYWLQVVSKMNGQYAFASLMPGMLALSTSDIMSLAAWCLRHPWALHVDVDWLIVRHRLT